MHMLRYRSGESSRRAAFLKKTALAFVLLASMVPVSASAEIVHFSGHFFAEKGVHKQSRLGVSVVPSGLISAVLNTDTHRLSYTLSYRGLSGHITVIHFHGPAAEGKDAPPLLTINPPYNTGMHQVITVSRTMENYLMKDKVYINLHTIENSKGEARAQLLLSKAGDPLDSHVEDDPLSNITNKTEDKGNKDTY